MVENDGKDIQVEVKTGHHSGHLDILTTDIRSSPEL